jgi:hypothetical protein
MIAKSLMMGARAGCPPLLWITLLRTCPNRRRGLENQGSDWLAQKFGTAIRYRKIKHLANFMAY